MKKVLDGLQRFIRALLGLVTVGLALTRMLQPPPEPLRAHAAGAADAGQPKPPAAQPESPARRRFMIGFIGLAGAAIGGIVGVPVIAFLIAPLTQKPPDQWRNVGLVDSFAVGSMTEVKLENPDPRAWAGATAQQGVWLRRVDEAQFQAFEINCTHLGCPVHWIDTARLFMCPCHGGVFYEDGSVAAPPPARPLVQHDVRINGSQVEVSTRALPITGHFLHPGQSS